jgi:hypothetical protein
MSPGEQAEWLATAFKAALSDEAAATAQTAEMPGAPEFTMRDMANALVVAAFRNGFVEELHAGRSSPLLTDPSLSRITDDEMKKLCLEMSAKLAHLLQVYLRTPDLFAAYMGLRLLPYAHGWEREARTFELPAVTDEVAKCAACGASLFSGKWRFCPSCGAHV